MNFNELDINEKIIKNVTEIGYSNLTKIQEKIIPLLLKEKCDVFACAQTGTGKTAAYALPLINQLIKNNPENENTNNKKIRYLIIAPTRELAIQIYQNIQLYSKGLPINIGLYYGGIKIQQQLKQNKKNVDIVVATPGRLLDLQKHKFIDLSKVEALVIDEADHMLNLGFIDEVKKIIALLPKQKQFLLFSATLSNEIKSFVEKMMKDPKFINATEPNSVNYSIKQSALLVKLQDRLASLVLLVQKKIDKKILIFTQTKKEANFLGHLFKSLDINNNVIHSDKKQNIRQSIIEQFKDNSMTKLIATDVISRGLHIDNIDLVINYQIPRNPESYVHRIGRTGRAGNVGQSISLYTREETNLLNNIEKLMKETIEKNNNWFDKEEIETEKAKLQVILDKKNFTPNKKFSNKNFNRRKGQLNANPKHKEKNLRIKFPLHNQLRTNLQKQHQIHKSLKKDNNDNW